MKEAAMGTTKRCIMVSRPRVSPASFVTVDLWSLWTFRELGAVVDDVEVETEFLVMFVGRAQFLMMTLVVLHHFFGKLESHMYLATDLSFKEKTKSWRKQTRAMEDGFHEPRLENAFFVHLLDPYWSWILDNSCIEDGMNTF